VISSASNSLANSALSSDGSLLALRNAESSGVSGESDSFETSRAFLVNASSSIPNEAAGLAASRSALVVLDVPSTWAFNLCTESLRILSVTSLALNPEALSSSQSITSLASESDALSTNSSGSSWTNLSEASVSSEDATGIADNLNTSSSDHSLSKFALEWNTSSDLGVESGEGWAGDNVGFRSTDD